MSHDVTQLLLQWNSGDEEARASLINHIYDELNEIARRHLVGERSKRDLAPNALVHEAYIKLIDMDRIQWQDRAHFLAMAARVMREILIDQARKRNAQKRDGGMQVTLSGIFPQIPEPSTDALAIHEALEKLAEIDADRAHLVELRFFGGLTIEETAEVLGSSPATVKRHWEVARGWLYKQMKIASKE
ncbi:MAG: ECF-type sigma factor [Pseudomonadota bacterium]